VAAAGPEHKVRVGTPRAQRQAHPDQLAARLVALELREHPTQPTWAALAAAAAQTARRVQRAVRQRVHLVAAVVVVAYQQPRLDLQAAPVATQSAATQPRLAVPSVEIPARLETPRMRVMDLVLAVAQVTQRATVVTVGPVVPSVVVAAVAAHPLAAMAAMVVRAAPARCASGRGLLKEQRLKGIAKIHKKPVIGEIRSCQIGFAV
jgi:hypothetical protein